MWALWVANCGIDAVGQGEELAGVGDVADIGGLLAGEDGEAGEAQDLRALHLGVPVGAFHEADHDLAVKPRGKGVEPVDHGAGAAAVGLHDDAEAVPACQRGVGEDRLDHLAATGRGGRPLRRRC